ncbi:hypothetical protein Tco_0290290 [Tanacetum coccineum]
MGSAPPTSQPPISSTSRRLTRQESVVPQPRSPTQTNVADKAASTGVDVRLGGATTTVTGLEAGQGSGNIDKTPTMPYDSPIPRVHTLRSDECRMQHNELMDLVTKLSDRVVALETNLTQTKKVYGATFTKLIKKVKRLEKKDKLRKSIRKLRLVLSDEEDFTTANVPVTTAGAEISIASPKVKTAGDSVDDIATEILVYIKRSAAKKKDKAALRLQEQLDEEERQRITRVYEAASSFNIEEWEDIQARIEADEELAQSNNEKGNTFTPIESDVDRTVPKIAAGSLKRDAEEELGQESSKRQKISESS